MSFSNRLNIERSKLKTRNFVWRDIEFKVLVPTRAEVAALQEQTDVVDQELAEKHFQHLVADNGVGTLRQDGDDYFVTLDDGSEKSLRALAKQIAHNDKVILMFMNLLVRPDMDVPFTIEDLDEDLSKNDQLELMSLISDTVSGKREDTKKN